MSSPTEAPRPKAVLVSVQLQGVADAEQQSSLKELKRLCETLGFEIVGEVTQKREGLGAATLLGTGKLVELAAWTGGTGVVRKIGDTWKIAHYNLTIPIPNDLAKSVVEMIRAKK